MWETESAGAKALWSPSETSFVTAKDKMECLPIKKRHARDSFKEDTSKNVHFPLVFITAKVEGHFRASVYLRLILRD